jgi:hypothetical protein
MGQNDPTVRKIFWVVDNSTKMTSTCSSMEIIQNLLIFIMEQDIDAKSNIPLDDKEFHQ